MRVPHLSFYDMNMGAGADGDALPPPTPDDDQDTASGPPESPHDPGCDTSDLPNSLIDCSRQVLEEEVPVSGTP